MDYTNVKVRGSGSVELGELKLNPRWRFRHFCIPLAEICKVVCEDILGLNCRKSDKDQGYGAYCKSRNSCGYSRQLLTVSQCIWLTCEIIRFWGGGGCPLPTPLVLPPM